VIESITIVSDSIYTEETVIIKVTASDSDGDSLNYSWIPDGGSISGSGSEITWTAPSEEGEFNILITITDGNGGNTSRNVTFIVTTAPNSGIVEGTASLPLEIIGDLSNTRISLYSSIELWNRNIPYISVISTDSGQSVSFVIRNVSAGKYYLDAWKDNDNDGLWSSGDFVGCFCSGGPGSQGISQFQVIKGETLSLTIDMYIY